MRRGKVRGLAFRGQPLGITPAYAGKSHRCYQQCRDGEDHPHVCGEKWKVSAAMLALTGSPPRLRGKGGITAYFPQLFGITPAFAGKSVKEKLSKGGGKDHPRVCGEKPMPMPFTVVVLGSPPRMRGKGLNPSFGFWTSRITPAYAGKSRANSYCGRFQGDHPRVCGEKLAVW